jgi:ABC-type antimicrobial peptide transport system permease subunit
MTSTFAVYLRLGFDHITAVGAWDHILFIVALGTGYNLTHWRRLLVLVTAFTVGHSITLALATLRLVSISSTLVEILIPITILATAVFNLFESGQNTPVRARRVKYAMALFFGLIHGLGFSTALRAMLGEEESIALPLFSFNVGLEIGQVAILSAALVLTWAVLRWGRLRPRLWTLILSTVTSLAALVLLAGRIPR